MVFVVRIVIHPCQHHALYVFVSEEELLESERALCPLCLPAEARPPPETRTARRRRRRRRRSAERDSSASD